MPGRPAEHEVHRAARGWLDLGRADARLWVGSGSETAPAGLRLVVRETGVAVDGEPGPGECVLVWELDPGRPGWAAD